MPNDSACFAFVSLLSNPGALAAYSALAFAVMCAARVLGSIRMPGTAMCSGLGCLRMGGDSRKRSQPPAKILLLGDWFQVPRIHATVNPAQVIKFQPFGDWTTKQFISHAVGPVRSPAFSVINPKVAVFRIAPGPSPKPAASIWLWMDVLQKTVNKCKLGLGHVTPSKSHRSGLYGASNRLAAQNYFSAGGGICPTK